MIDSKKQIPILYLIDAFTKGSGTENQLEITINNLDRNRFAPYLVVLKDVEPEQVSGINCEVLSLDIQKLLSVKTLVILWKFIKLLKNNNIKILQIFFQDSNIFGVIAGRLAGIKNIIISRRDMGWWYNTKYLKIANIVNRFSKYCIANAEAVKEQVVKYESFDANQVSVIYNGIEPKKIRDNIISKNDFNIPEESNIIGIVANLKAIKRIDLFLEMAAILNNGRNHFIIVGQGVLEKGLKKQVDDLGLTQNVHFFHTTDKINETIRLFDVGVLTSKSEGLSNVLIEYSINEVPTVAFDVGGNREIIVEGKTGHLIKPYDVKDLSAKIELVLQDNTDASYFDSDTRSKIRDKFSIRQLKQQTEQYYETVLGDIK